MAQPPSYARRGLAAKGQPHKANSPAKPIRRSHSPGQPKFVRLSHVLKDNPCACDGTKLSLVDKGIGVIDRVADGYRDIETLFLSNNGLRSLEGIAQFPRLRVLSVANNDISTFADLDALATLKNLTILNLEYNPVSQLPNYRAHVLKRAPGLRNLDNKEVTKAERSTYEHALQKEDRMLDMMHSNYCLIRKLEMGLQKVKLHDELRSALQSHWPLRTASATPGLGCFDVQTFLKLCNANFMTHDDREGTMQLLRKAVRKVRNVKLFTMGKLVSSAAGGGPAAIVGVGESWEPYFNELLQQQQNQIAELLTTIDEYCQRHPPLDDAEAYSYGGPNPPASHGTGSRRGPVQRGKRAHSPQHCDAVPRLGSSVASKATVGPRSMADLENPKRAHLRDGAESGIPVIQTDRTPQPRVCPLPEPMKQMEATTTYLKQASRVHQGGSRIPLNPSGPPGAHPQSSVKEQESQPIAAWLPTFEEDEDREEVDPSPMWPSGPPRASSPVRYVDSQPQRCSQPVSEPTRTCRPPSSPRHVSPIRSPSCPPTDPPAEAVDILDAIKAAVADMLPRRLQGEVGTRTLANGTRRGVVMSYNVPDTPSSSNSGDMQQNKLGQAREIDRFESLQNQRTLQWAFYAWRRLWESRMQGYQDWEVAVRHCKQQLVRRHFRQWRRYVNEYCRDLQARLQQFYGRPLSIQFRSPPQTTARSPARASPGSPERYTSPKAIPSERPMLSHARPPPTTAACSDLLTATAPMAPVPVHATSDGYHSPLRNVSSGIQSLQQQRTLAIEACAQRAQLRRLHRCFRAWMKFTYVSKRHVQSKQLLANFADHRSKNLKLRAFYRWMQRWHYEQRLKSAERLLTEQRVIHLQRNAFHRWVQRHAHHCWTEWQAAAGQLLQTRSAMEEQQRRLTGDDIEKVRLLDRIQQLNREKTRLVADLSEARKEVEQLAKGMEEGLIIQTALRREAETLKLKARDQDAATQRLRDQMALSHDDHATLYAQHMLLAGKYEHRIKTLTDAMRQAERQLEAAQTEAQCLRHEKENSKLEANTKLSTALQIAAALRHMLDQTDQEMRELELTKAKQQQRLGDCEEQLRSTTGRLAQGIDEKDRIIEDLQHQVHVLQSHVNAGTVKLSEYQQALEDKEASLRRLQHECTLLQAREAQTTERYLSSVQGSPVQGIFGDMQPSPPPHDVTRAEAQLNDTPSPTTSEPADVPQPKAHHDAAPLQSLTLYTGVTTNTNHTDGHHMDGPSDKFVDTNAPTTVQSAFAQKAESSGSLETVVRAGSRSSSVRPASVPAVSAPGTPVNLMPLNSDAPWLQSLWQASGPLAPSPHLPLKSKPLDAGWCATSPWVPFASPAQTSEGRPHIGWRQSEEMSSGAIRPSSTGPQLTNSSRSLTMSLTSSSFLSTLPPPGTPGQGAGFHPSTPVRTPNAEAYASVNERIRSLEESLQARLGL